MQNNTKYASKEQKRNIMEQRKANKMARYTERHNRLNEKAFWALQSKFAFEECDYENGRYVFSLAGELVAVA